MEDLWRNSKNNGRRSSKGGAPEAERGTQARCKPGARRSVSRMGIKKEELNPLQRALPGEPHRRRACRCAFFSSPPRVGRRRHDQPQTQTCCVAGVCVQTQGHMCFKCACVPGRTQCDGRPWQLAAIRLAARKTCNTAFGILQAGSTASALGATAVPLPSILPPQAVGMGRRPRRSPVARSATPRIGESDRRPGQQPVKALCTSMRGARKTPQIVLPLSHKAANLHTRAHPQG
jgi:hypothetical protein